MLTTSMNTIRSKKLEKNLKKIIRMICYTYHKKEYYMTFYLEKKPKNLS